MKILSKEERQYIGGKATQDGKNNERKLCRYFTEFTGCKFMRTPASGGSGVYTMAAFMGDVTPQDPNFYFPFVIETKLQGRPEVVFSTISNKENDLKSLPLNWYKQAYVDALRAKEHKFNKIPLVYVSLPDITGWLVFFKYHQETVQQIKTEYGISPFRVVSTEDEDLGLVKLVIYRSKDFDVIGYNNLVLLLDNGNYYV